MSHGSFRWLSPDVRRSCWHWWENTADVYGVRGRLGSVYHSTESVVDFVECSRLVVYFSGAADDGDIRYVRVFL